MEQNQQAPHPHTKEALLLLQRVKPLAAGEGYQDEIVQLVCALFDKHRLAGETMGRARAHTEIATAQRNHYAAMAMQGIISGKLAADYEINRETVALSAVGVADALMAELAKPRQS